MLKGSKILGRQAKNIFANDCLGRSKHSAQGLKLQTLGSKSSKSGFHQSQVQEYPATEPLPLPSNIEDLASSEKLKFSPRRNRDISGSFISSMGTENQKSYLQDVRTECYDCTGAVSLSSTMQTNVPYPFTSKGKPTHLNMPGGQWGQYEKYVSDDLNNCHHTNNTTKGGTCAHGFRSKNRIFLCLLNQESLYCSSRLGFSINSVQFRNFCTMKKNVENSDRRLNEKVETKVPVLSNKEKLKAAVKDYGSVIIVFHVGISLLSLGCCYLAVASGIDLSSIIKTWGSDEGAATVGTTAQFVVAYAVHKTMAPGRIVITLTVVPFIVKKLRKIGFLKAPKIPK